MPNATTIIRERQLAIRRELDRRGKSLKVVAYDSGLPYDTLRSYFPGGDTDPATISGAAIHALCGVLPGDLLSLLLPDGFLVVRVPEGVDHGEIGKWAADYLARKNAAHDPASECAEAIGPGEQSALDDNVAQFPVAA